MQDETIQKCEEGIIEVTVSDQGKIEGIKKFGKAKDFKSY